MTDDKLLLKQESKDALAGHGLGVGEVVVGE